MKLRLIFLLAALGLASHATAGEKSALSIRSAARGTLSGEVRDVVASMSAAGDTRLALPSSDAKVECLDLKELKDVTVCVFNTARFMNAALNRASEYVEVAKGRVLTDLEHAGNDANGAVEGHDLQGADCAPSTRHGARPVPRSSR